MGSPKRGKITVRHQLFAEAYVKNGMNATEAARAAGYTGSTGVLATLGARALKNATVRDWIQANLRQEGIESTEVLGLLVKHLRGDMTNFVTATGDVRLDLEAARAGKRLGIVQQLEVEEDSYTTDDGVTHTKLKKKIKLYSSQDAADKLCRALGLYAKKDEGSKLGQALSDEQMLQMCQRYEIPKKKWPPGVLRYYESITKTVKSRDAK
jgi:phage terminase small subunit